MKTNEAERAIDNLSHRKNRSRRGIGMRRKTAVSIFAVLIAATLIASGALLSYYGQIQTTANITQALDLNGHDWNDPISFTIGSPAGNTYVKGPVRMRNYADSPIPVIFDTTRMADYDDDGYYTNDASDAVTVRYFGELLLENKDDNWDVKEDTTSGNLKYYLDGPTFDYEFNATGLTPAAGYALIYYADFGGDRFEEWGGNNPGALIGTFTTDAAGAIALTTGIVNLGMDLPSGTDANIDEYSYCPDEFKKTYDLCHGAKIWLVLSDDYDTSTKGLKSGVWNPTTYLFETNLISYHDTNVTGTEFMAYQGLTNFWIEYTFASATMPGSYRIITEVQPS